MLDLSFLRKTQVEAREYQVKAAERLFEEKKLLVVMPTAMGKTFVAILAIAHLLKHSPKKILFLAPTKPLVLQQAKRIGQAIDSTEETAFVTGEVDPEERKKKYQSATIICATPQTIKHDLIASRLSLDDFSLIVFDEAHRAIGQYAYVFVGERAAHSNALVLALTASPSSERKKISAVCANLGINAVEIKTNDDADVKKFVKEVNVTFEFVDLPQELLVVRKSLQDLLSEPLKKLMDRGFVTSTSMVSKKQMLALRIRFLTMAKRNPAFYSYLSDVARAMNLMHAIDLLESEGVQPLLSFIEGLSERKTQTKAVARLIADPRLEKIRKECKSLVDRGIEHPKIGKLKGLVSKLSASGKNAIVFAHYRDSVQHVISHLNSIPGVKAKALVGRAGGGMNQKQQHAIIESFRDGEFNVLVATSVGEEGLDIPSVDMVIFFEAVPSEIRLIQRRGRAGRTHVGEAVVLVAKGTKDEAYLWMSRNKEKKMQKQLERMQHMPSLNSGNEDETPKSKESKEGGLDDGDAEDDEDIYADDGAAKTKPKRKGQTSLGDY